MAIPFVSFASMLSLMYLYFGPPKNPPVKSSEAGVDHAIPFSLVWYFRFSMFGGFRSSFMLRIDVLSKDVSPDSSFGVVQ